MIRYLSFSLYAKQKAEMYLNRMESKGWRLSKKIGPFLIFNKHNGKPEMVQLAYSSEAIISDTDQQRNVTRHIHILNGDKGSATFDELEAVKEARRLK